MNIMEENNKLIKKLLKIAVKNNDFENFVLMRPNYCIESRDLNGFVVPNRYYTMNAIYECYKEDSSLQLDVLLYNALINISKKYKGERAIETVLETVKYHLDAEKNNVAPFKIDCQSILNELRNMLLKNKDMYMEKKEVFNNVPFWNNIEEYDSTLLNNYGHKIL